MKGKMLKKTLSCLLAIMMVVASVPVAGITAQAASYSATVTDYNVFRGNNATNVDRFDESNKILKVCNDNTSENFTIGFVNFDVTNVSCNSNDVLNAYYNFNVSMASNCSDNQGMGVYYPMLNTDDFTDNYKNASNYATIGSYLYQANQASYNAIFTGGSGTTHEGADFIGNAKSYYLLQPLAQWDTNPTTSTDMTVDIGPAIKAAKLAGKSKATVCFMLKSHGDTGAGKGWSDTEVKLTFTSSISVQTSTANNTNVRNSIDSSINTVKSLPSDVYVGNADSSLMKGVKVAGSWPDESQRKINSTDIRVHGWKNLVAVYTGTGSDIRFPFIARDVGGSGGNTQFRIDYIYFDDGTNFKVGGDTWTRCSGHDNLTGFNDHNHDFKSYKTWTNPNNFYATEGKTWRNYITYYGTGNTVNYYDKLSSIAFEVKSHYNGNTSVDTVYNYNSDLYVLNYAPIKSLIESSEFKTLYNTVKNNEANYEQTSVVNYYNAVKALLDFNVMDGITNTNASTQVPINAKKIKKLLDDYNSYSAALKFNYTFKANDGNTTVFAAQDEATTYKYAVTNNKISNSAASTKTYKDNSKHKWYTYSWPATATNYVFTEVATENEEDCTVSDGKCTVCGKVFLDYTAFYTALDEADGLITEGLGNLYTVESFAEYQKVYLQLKDVDDTATTQKEIDDATIQLLYAKALLAKKTANVTLVIYDKDDKKIEETTPYENIERGETVTVTPATEHNVVKWVVVSGDAKYEVVGENASLDIVLTDDTTVEAHCDDSVTDTSVAYTKVVFKGANGKVVDIRYVKAGETLNTSDVDKPSVALYNVSDWSVASVTGSADTKVVNVTVSCEPQSTNMCEVYFPGKPNDPVKMPYNTRVDIKDYMQTSDYDYALCADLARSKTIAYLDGTVFYVPARAKVYVTAWQKGTKTTMINTTGVYSTLVGDYKKIGFNNKFTLTEGCTAVEWGIIFIATKSDGTITTSTKMPVKALSPEKEFTATISVSKTNTTYQSIRAKAYLKYKDSTDVEKTIYGTEYTQAFTTDTVIGGTEVE